MACISLLHTILQSLDFFFVFFRVFIHFGTPWAILGRQGAPDPFGASHQPHALDSAAPQQRHAAAERQRAADAEAGNARGNWGNIWIHLGVSIKWGYPKNGWFIRENSILEFWGFPYKILVSYGELMINT